MSKLFLGKVEYGDIPILLPNGRYQCLVCGKDYSTQTTLNRHYKEIHLGQFGEMLNCDLCGYKSKRPRNFRTHLKNKHNYTNEMMNAEGIPRV